MKRTYIRRDAFNLCCMLTRAKEQLILVGRVKDEKSLIKYEQLAVSDTHIAVNERLTATNPFVLIYGVLASINRFIAK